MNISNNSNSDVMIMLSAYLREMIKSDDDGVMTASEITKLLQQQNDTYSFGLSSDEITTMSEDFLEELNSTDADNTITNTNGTGMFSGMSTIRNFDNNDVASKAYEDIYGGETLDAEEQIKYLNEIGINPSADGYTQSSTVDEEGNESYFFYKTNTDGSTEYLKVLKGTDGEPQLVQTILPEGSNTGTTNVYDHTYLKGMTSAITNNKAAIQASEARFAETLSSTENAAKSSLETTSTTGTTDIQACLTNMAEATSSTERAAAWSDFMSVINSENLSDDEKNYYYNEMIAQVEISQLNDLNSYIESEGKEIDESLHNAFPQSNSDEEEKTVSEQMYYNAKNSGSAEYYGNLVSELAQYKIEYTNSISPLTEEQMEGLSSYFDEIASDNKMFVFGSYNYENSTSSLESLGIDVDSFEISSFSDSSANSQSKKAINLLFNTARTTYDLDSDDIDYLLNQVNNYIELCYGNTCSNTSSAIAMLSVLPLAEDGMLDYANDLAYQTKRAIEQQQ